MLFWWWASTAVARTLIWLDPLLSTEAKHETPGLSAQPVWEQSLAKLIGKCVRPCKDANKMRLFNERGASVSTSGMTEGSSGIRSGDGHCGRRYGCVDVVCCRCCSSLFLRLLLLLLIYSPAVTMFNLCVRFGALVALLSRKNPRPTLCATTYTCGCNRRASTDHRS
jgi:hypothetical protein